MQRNLLIITTSAFFALTAFAHGGFDHVMGTVAKLDANVLTVTTTKGDVKVKLDAKTEITKADKKAVMTDLVTGARVVVDIPEGSKDMLAHSVKIGAAAAGAKGATDSHAHDAHK